MPGIITHSRLVSESLTYLRRKKDFTPYTRSVEILFNNKSFFKNALFGSLGPNIFEYVPFQQKGFFGTEITDFLHSQGLKASITYMMEQTLMSGDHTTEWASTRRAFLYGYVSHIIADSVFHPFIFYWSGFPESGLKKEINLQREQYVLFAYNLDLFFEYFYGGEVYKFQIDDILPLKAYNGRFAILENSIKDLIMDMISTVYPDVRERIFFKNVCKMINDGHNRFTALDSIPYIIRFCFRYKRSRNTRLTKLFEKIQRKGIIYPDYTAHYPEPRRINRHVLNLHRERWYYPAGKKGLNYESVEDLFKTARDKIIDIWEKMEKQLYVSKPDLTALIREISIDSYTGEYGKYPHSMNIKNPVRLRF